MPDCEDARTVLWNVTSDLVLVAFPVTIFDGSHFITEPKEEVVDNRYGSCELQNDVVRQAYERRKKFVPAHGSPLDISGAVGLSALEDVDEPKKMSSD